MTATVEQFSALSGLAPYQADLVLPHCDTIDMAWANIVAGLTSFIEIDDETTLVQGTEQPIHASPYCDLSISDAGARVACLIEDLLPKILSWTFDKSFGLVLTGHWPQKLVAQITSVLSVKPQLMVQQESLLETLFQWERAQESSALDQWIWISAHSGCDFDSLERNRDYLACSQRSDGLLSTDVAVAIEMRSSQKPYLLTGAEEEAHSNPLMQNPEALKRLIQEYDYVQQRNLFHNLQDCPESDIELYKLKQYIDSLTPLSKVEALLVNRNDRNLALAQSVGHLGVCALPFQLMVQQIQSADNGLLAITGENSHRFIWSPKIIAVPEKSTL